MFEKCIPMSKPKRGVVNTHQVIVLKFLHPEVCNSYFSYVTGGKFCIFSSKKKIKIFSLMCINIPQISSLLIAVLFVNMTRIFSHEASVFNSLKLN